MPKVRSCYRGSLDTVVPHWIVQHESSRWVAKFDLGGTTDGDISERWEEVSKNGSQLDSLPANLE